MPSHQNAWTSPSQASIRLRLGAAIAVVSLHVAVIGAVFFSDSESPQLLEPEAVMVSVIEAPVAQVAKADPTPQPPVAESVPPEPEIEPELEPEPEPIIEKAPEPAPPPKPKPKPKPKPVPPPKPAPKPEVKPDPTPALPPTGAPDGELLTQAPRQGPPSDQPIMLSNVEYLGVRPLPVYPSASRRLREEGRVVVLVEISTQGLVDKASVDTSSGFSRLDESALSAARKARFKPLTRNGVAYPAKAKLPFDFVIRN